jgi:hypothetical protein
LARILILVTLGPLASQAGNLSGKVTPGKGNSVVWVEAATGKTFPKPDKSFSLYQKSLVFQPHILIVPAGATVEFPQQRQRAAQHLLAVHQQQQETGPQFGDLAQRPDARISI